jgi:hypothetical protein
LKEIRAEIDIHASANRVWNVLVDFHKYHEWNPFIYRVTGSAIAGAKITINIRTPSGKEREYEPTIMSIDNGRELRWMGKAFFLEGEHSFSLEAIDTGSTRFIQREIFRGPISLFFGKRTDKDISAGFEQMNQALKCRAELGSD